jgi:RecA/RadA recombinase
VPAKKAAKKTAKKAAKTAKKTAGMTLEDPDQLPQLVFKKRFTPEESGGVYNKMAENVRKSIDVVSNRSKTRKVNLLTPAMLRKMLMPYDEIVMQHALGAIGVRVPSVIEVIAPEHVGKTTFCFDLIGRLVMSGCHVIYIECEGKMMKDTHIKRILHRDKKTATALMNAVVFATARTLVECDEVIRKTVADVRTRCDSNPETKGNPIFVLVDPWSGLMSSAEAKGNSDWGLGATAKKEAPKDAGTGSNMGHAKHAQILKRWLPNFLEVNNAVAMFFNHQNQRVDMGGFKRPGMPPPPESTNDTTIGGRAFRQFASYRFIMLPAGEIRDRDKKIVGFKVAAHVKKNAYGPRSRKWEFEIYFDSYVDTATTYDQVLSYGESTASWMAKNRILDTTVSNNLYTCDALGCVAVTGRELYNALMANHDKLSFVGAALGIEGYESEVTAEAREKLLASVEIEPEDEEEEEPEEEDGDGDEAE